MPNSPSLTRDPHANKISPPGLLSALRILKWRLLSPTVALVNFINFFPLPSYLYFIMVEVRDYRTSPFIYIVPFGMVWHSVEMLYLFAFHVQVKMSLCDYTLFLKRGRKLQKKKKGENYPNVMYKWLRMRFWFPIFLSLTLGFVCDFFFFFFISKKYVSSAQGFSVLEGSGNKSLSPELMKSSLRLEPSCSFLPKAPSTLQNEQSAPHKHLKNGDAC